MTTVTEADTHAVMTAVLDMLKTIHDDIHLLKESQANVENFVEQFGVMMSAVQPTLEQLLQHPMIKAFIGG